MAVLTVVINASAETIANLTNKVMGVSTGSSDNTNGEKALNNLINLLSGMAGGAAASATVQMTTRDTDPSVATSGTGSTQLTYTL